jgi:hypothetical protein
MQDKKSVLPGKELSSSVLKTEKDNHFQVFFENEPWYIYAPHWKIYVDQLQLSIQDLQTQAIKKLPRPLNKNSLSILRKINALILCVISFIHL